MAKKSRFWVSWWSGCCTLDGCSEPPFQIWVTGQGNTPDGRDILAICAVIDAKGESEVWEAVKRHFPDFIERFCEKRNRNYTPLECRFPGFENRTSRASLREFWISVRRLIFGV
jgi:hypothetical protein